MPAIPYKPSAEAGPADVVDPIIARRGGKLLNIDRMLLHSVPLTVGWGALLGKVRNEFCVVPKIRELAICAVSAFCGAEYEMHHHGDVFLKAGGTPAQFNALRNLREAMLMEKIFSPLERAVLQLSFEMTRNVRVPQTLLSTLRNELGDTQLVELVGIIATYNMVARFVVSLGVDVEGNSA